MALHEQCTGATDEWYTPPHVFRALGCSFDMDVSSPGGKVTPWIPAVRFINANSLECEWGGFVWMNPPFGGRNGLVPWLDKFFQHSNGIALTPDRTSAPWWQQFAPRAGLILFVAPKLKFIGADGKPGKSPAQGTCLMAAGRRALEPLHRAAAEGLGTLMRPLEREALAMWLLTDPRVFNYLIMSLYIANAGRWAWYGSWGDVGYWICAAGITASVTWGFHR